MKMKKYTVGPVMTTGGVWVSHDEYVSGNLRSDACVAIVHCTCLKQSCRQRSGRHVDVDVGHWSMHFLSIFIIGSLKQYTNV